MSRHSRVILAFAMLLVVTSMVGCAKEEPVRTGVYKGQEQWSIGSEGKSDQKIEVELDGGEKVLADMPAERPESGSTLKVQKQKDGSWKVVE